MKPRMVLTRHIVQRFAWMQVMLRSLARGAEANVGLCEGVLELRAVTDIGKALVGGDGIKIVVVPNEATDDEAEAILRKFVDDLPEPKE